jgi:hypothetical protein
MVLFRDVLEQILGLKPLLAEQARLVTIGAIAEKRNNAVAWPKLLGHFNSCHNVES